ncbi:hypothetical protein E9993_13645 [Labilibacter sediminis]|nr:hypothetical protein E9993_13645 [Labilibacter sediminis]
MARICYFSSSLKAGKKYRYTALIVFGLGIVSTEYGSFNFFTLIVTYLLFVWFGYRSISFAFNKGVVLKCIRNDWI